MTRDFSAARNPTGNTVPSVIGTSPKMSPGRRSPTTRSIPSTSLTASMRPSSTAKRARSPASWAAYSPGTRLISAAARESRSRSAASSAAKAVIPRISSGVTTRTTLLSSRPFSQVAHHHRPVEAWDSEAMPESSIMRARCPTDPRHAGCRRRAEARRLAWISARPRIARRHRPRGSGLRWRHAAP